MDSECCGEELLLPSQSTLSIQDILALSQALLSLPDEDSSTDHLTAEDAENLEPLVSVSHALLDASHMCSASRHTTKANLSSLELLICGSISGAVAKTIMAPLDRVKLLYFVSPSRSLSFKSATKTFKTIWKATGVRGLFKGNASAMWRVIPYSGITFTTYSKARVLLTSHVQKSSIDPSLHRHIVDFSAGAIAGITATFITHPLDLIRARAGAHWSIEPLYKDALSGIAHIVKNEGIRGLYAGIFPSIVGIIPYSGASFYLFERFKALAAYWTDTHVTQINTPLRLLSGGLAAAIASALVHPLHVVRRRMQVYGVAKDTPQYTNTISALKDIYKKEGVRRGLFKGLLMTQMKAPVANAISFALNDTLTHRVDLMKQDMKLDARRQERERQEEHVGKCADEYRRIVRDWEHDRMRREWSDKKTQQGTTTAAVSAAAAAAASATTTAIAADIADTEDYASSGDALGENTSSTSPSPSTRTSASASKNLPTTTENVVGSVGGNAVGTMVHDGETDFFYDFGSNRVSGPDCSGQVDAEAVSSASANGVVTSGGDSRSSGGDSSGGENGAVASGTATTTTTNTNTTTGASMDMGPGTGTSAHDSSAPPTSSVCSSALLSYLQRLVPSMHADSTASSTSTSDSTFASISAPASSPSTTHAGVAITDDAHTATTAPVATSAPTFSPSSTSSTSPWLPPCYAAYRAALDGDYTPAVDAAILNTCQSQIQAAYRNHPATMALLEQDLRQKDDLAVFTPHVPPLPHAPVRLSNTTLLAIGAIAGCVSKTAICPADNIKIMFQVNPQKHFTLRNALRTGISVFRERGWDALWRGNGASLVRTAPYAAITYMTYDNYSEALDRLMPSSETTTAPHTHTPQKQQQQQNKWFGKKNQAETRKPSALVKFLAGGFAGITATAFTYPLDMMRVRMASSIWGSTHPYKSYTHGFQAIVQAHGWRSLYSGLGPTLIGIFPYTGTSFCVYNSLKDSYARFSGSETPVPLQMMFGGVAALISQSICYPLDVVRRRKQMGMLEGLSTRQCFQYIWRNEGWRNFYKSLSMNWIKGPVAAGISFMTNDRLKALLGMYKDVSSKSL